MTTLYLLPNVLFDETDSEEVFVPQIEQIVSSLEGLFCESEKLARRFLRRFLSHEAMQQVQLVLLNEHTTAKEQSEMIQMIRPNSCWGVISDAGLPCIADPGALLVTLARKQNIAVEAIAGPCSFIMALQLSGFFSQQFSFHGYLPKEDLALKNKLHNLAKQAEHAVQIWMETPYRNQKMLNAVEAHCLDSLSLCVVQNLGKKPYWIKKGTISEWRSTVLSKDPAVFLLFKDIYCS